MLFVNNLDQNGSHEQRSRFLPAACDGTMIAGMCMSEPGAGDHGGAPTIWNKLSSKNVQIWRFTYQFAVLLYMMYMNTRYQVPHKPHVTPL